MTGDSTSMPASVPRPFFVVSLANFLFFLSFAFFFLLPLWVLDKGGGEEVAGRVIGVQGFAGLAVLPLVGYMLDRFGRRRFMISGTAVACACSFAYTLIETVGPMLYLLRIVHGVAFTCAFTGAQTLAVLYAPFERRAEAIGWFGISTIVTHAISPALGEQIIATWGFDAMFLVAGAVGAAACALSCTLPRPPALRLARRATEVDPSLARRAVAAASFAMVCYGFGFGALQTFVPVFMERFELGRVGVFFVCWSLAAVTVRVLLGGASDRYGRRRVLVPAMVTMSTALLVVAFVRSQAGIVLVAIVFGLAQGLLYPTMNALVADWSNPSNIGRTQSLFSGSYSLGISSCSFFFGSIVERYGYPTMFLASLAITAVGLLVFVSGPHDLAAEDATLASGDETPRAV